VLPTLLLLALAQSFDAVSVKHTQIGPVMLRAGETVTFKNEPITRKGTRVTGNQTFHSFIKWAYDLPYEWQVSGPDWFDSDFYQVEAVLPAEATLADARVMMRAMLADRFGLKCHPENREIAVYALTVAKGGLKVDEVPKPEHYGYGFRPGGRFEANPAMPMSAFVSQLRIPAGRPVLDETGLTGFYPIRLEWTPDPADRKNEGILSTLSKLGLKLEPKKMMYDVIVVDSASKEPTPN
jgi:uncharacterized protein (TIGR03435 family)